MSNAPDVVDPPRPLWRKVWEFPLVAMSVALALVAALMVALGAGFAMLPADIDPALAMTIRGVVAVAATFALYKIAIRHLGRHRRDDLPLASMARDTALGLGAGFVLFSVIVAIAALLGVYRITGWGDGSDAVFLLVQTGLFAGFWEELVLRGIIFRWLEEWLGSWIALALSALLFGFAHAWNPNASVFSSLAIAIEAGILLGAAYMLTRNLWLAIGLHAGWNVTQGLIWDVPVSGNAVSGLVESQRPGPVLLSGGEFGLEASVIALVVATGAGVWMLRRVWRAGGIVAPFWSRRSAALPS